MPKAFHPKSRKGCARCKARKVKCDEVHPVCGACQRHGAKCEFKLLVRDNPNATSAATADLLATHPITSSVTAPQEIRPATSAGIPTIQTNHQTLVAPGLPSPLNSVSPIAVGTSAASLSGRTSSMGQSVSGSNPLDWGNDNRRILELQLFHNYTESVCKQFLSPEANERWRTATPRLAWRHPFLLDAMFAFSALQIAKQRPEEPEWDTLHTEYFSRAAEGQRLAVAHINGDNAEAIFATTCLISDYAFFNLRGGTIARSPPSDYTLPLNWLRITRGTRPLYAQTHKWLMEGDFAHLITNLPLDMTRDSLLFMEEKRRPFDPYARWEWDQHTISPEEKDAFSKMLSFIGTLHFAIKNHEDPLVTCRRIIVFPARIPERFISMVQECHPRAVALLGHIFVLLRALNPPNWWFDGVAETQIQGINSMLPTEWRELMHLGIQNVFGTEILD